jgi:16S rRNA (uracil1498-N3)-methyltransferase
MRLHRFILDVDLRRSPLTIRDEAVLKQWTKVLRLAAGDHVILCDGKGMESEATLESITNKNAGVLLHGAHPVNAEPKRSVTLYCSILKRENFEWVVQKCTEVGVQCIVPIVTERTVKTGLKIERLRIIAKEAAEQSGRGMIPDISDHIEFDRALREANKTTNIFFHCNTASTQPFNHSTIQPFNEKIEEHSHQTLGIWIGPEGGWTEEEVQKAEENGFKIGSLGILTLRAETAAVIGAYLAVELGNHS